MKKRLKIPRYAYYLLGYYAIALVVFGLLRLVLLLKGSSQQFDMASTQVRRAFSIGVQFDSVVLAYILVLPVVLFFIHSLVHRRFLLYCAGVVLAVAAPIALFFSIADIPYFKFFQNRLSSSSLQWLGTPRIVLDMIVSNTENLIFLIVAVVLCAFIFWLVAKSFQKRILQNDWQKESAGKD